MNHFEPQHHVKQVLGTLKDKIFVLGDSSKSVALVYDPATGIFRDGERAIRLQAHRLLGEYVRTAHIDEILRLVQLQAPRATEEDFDKDLDHIVFSNGVLKVRENRFAKFSHKFMCRTRIPNRYDPTAKCPGIDKFLGEVVGLEYQPLIEEMHGCALAGDVRHQKALLLLGSGANGKSVLARIAESMVGTENTANVPLDELTNNTFYRAELRSKRLNIYADMSPVSIKNVGLFKSLISGDRIQADRKYRDPFAFSSRAILVFACNKLPEFEENTYAVMRRLVVIPFCHHFDERDADPDLANKLTVPTEISGLINRAMSGYRRLLENRRFTIPPASSEALERHFGDTDFVEAFLREMTVENPHTRTAKDDLYLAYCLYFQTDRYIASMDVQPVSRRKFNAALNRTRPLIRSGKMSATDRRDAWIGIDFQALIRDSSAEDPAVSGSNNGGIRKSAVSLTITNRSGIEKK